MPAQWIRPTGWRICGPYASSVPSDGIPTGQPRVHTSPDQFVSKYAVGLAACEPNQLTYWLITADWRSEADIAL